MFTEILRSTLALAVATTATLAVIAGSAAPVAAAEAVTVDVSAYNLQSGAGRAAAETAIETAAEQLCATGTPEQTAAAKASRACYTAAMASALPQLDALAARGTRLTVASISLASPGR